MSDDVAGSAEGAVSGEDAGSAEGPVTDAVSAEGAATEEPSQPAAEGGDASEGEAVRPPDVVGLPVGDALARLADKGWQAAECADAGLWPAAPAGRAAAKPGSAAEPGVPEPSAPVAEAPQVAEAPEAGRVARVKVVGERQVALVYVVPPPPPA